jgi:hypothetical protein
VILQEENFVICFIVVFNTYNNNSNQLQSSSYDPRIVGPC